MNFSSHLKNTATEIAKTLQYDKPLLCENFLTILHQSADLLKTRNFDFWINQLEENNYYEIAMTYHAVSYNRQKWVEISTEQNRDRSLFDSIVLDTCEQLFTYWVDGDDCQYQSQFYYYKSNETGDIFKESELGVSVPISLDNILSQSSATSIALISDLKPFLMLTDLY